MDILHQPEKRRFVVTLEQGEAELEYTLRDRTLTITHTYVPPTARAQGVAGKMTAAALEYAHEQALNVVPICSFAVSYMAREARRQERA